MKADQAHTFALHNTMQELTTEMAEQAPGSEVVMTRLAEVLFIQVLQAYIATSIRASSQNHSASALAASEELPSSGVIPPFLSCVI